MNNRYLKKVRKKSKKSVVLLVSLCMLFGLTCGVTFAYLSTNTDPVVNEFTLSKVTTTVVEKFENNVKSDVQIKNTGDTTAYIRVAVVVTWKDQDGNIYGQQPVLGTDYTIEYNLTDGWLKANATGGDGFYYWTKPVLAGELTGVLITKCEPIQKAPADGYFLNVEIVGSGIQSTPTKVVTENWNSGVAGIESDGTSLKIKTIISSENN